MDYNRILASLKELISKMFDEELPSPLILIVDDQPQNLQMLSEILRQNQYQIAAANSGATALKVLERKKPDLILLDVIMPEMNGFEVCKRIKEDENTRDIPIMFLTAKTELEDMVEGFNSGGVDYITKPFNTTELLARVKTHTDLKRARDMLLKYTEALQQLTQEKAL